LRPSPNELLDGIYVGKFQRVKLDAHALAREGVYDHALRLDRVAGGEVEADDNLGAGLEGIARNDEQSADADVVGAADGGHPGRP
jgi:hypothetical protein